MQNYWYENGYTEKVTQFPLLWKNEVRVEFHLSEGYTMISCDSSLRFTQIVIPTRPIPPNLRAIGSRFKLTVYQPHWDICQTIEDVKDALTDAIRIER